MHMVANNGNDVMREAVKEEYNGLNGSRKRNARPILVVKFMTPMSLDLITSECAPGRCAQCHE